MRLTTVGAPSLVAVAHGTADERGAAVVEELLDRVRRARPRLVVRAAYLGHAAPSLPEMLGEVAGTAIVVPLLLSRGYHVGSDVPSLAGGALVARPLGPHRLLAMALRARLADAGAPPAATTLLGFAGSKWPAALADVKRQARLLGPGIATTTAQEAAATVERLAAGGRRPVALASYVLTPCRFHERLRAAGADVVGDPLGDHPAVARLVLLRYDEAVWAATRRHRPWALSR